MPQLGEETFAKNLTTTAGGGAFITAATISALDQEVSLLATLPAAPFDQIVKTEMAAVGISPELCQSAPNGFGPQLTVATVIDGDRSFLTHNAGPALPDAPLPSGEWRHLHVGELRTLADHPDLIAQARGLGMTISVDCGWDESVVHQGSQVVDLLAGIDVFLPNETEFNALTASGCREDVAPLVVVKCGKEGARALTAGDWHHQPGIPTEVVDTTGAGDSFNGGFIVSWLSGLPLPACLAKGNQCGAASVSGVGGTCGVQTLRSRLAV
jgi:sugar/nucleoside kinase (ribokinase family)